jgi:hypothetical protein
MAHDVILIPFPYGWKVKSFDESGEDDQPFEATVENEWGIVTALGKTRAEAVFNAADRGNKLMADGAPRGRYHYFYKPEVYWRAVMGTYSSASGNLEPGGKFHHFSEAEQYHTYETIDPDTGLFVTHKVASRDDVPFS